MTRDIFAEYVPALLEARRLDRLEFLARCERYGLDPLIHSARWMDALITDKCEGVAAVWCPIHGTCKCRCDRPGCYAPHEDRLCPLHSPNARHLGVGLRPHLVWGSR